MARIDSMQPTGTLTVPLVIHILWHDETENLSDAQVLSQLQALNQDYAGQNMDRQYVPAEFQAAAGNPDIRFCLAASDPIGQPTVAIERRYTEQAQFGTTQDWNVAALGGLDGWDPSRYLNIWVVNTGQYVTGFASYPGQSPFYNGVVIHPKYFGIQDDPHYGLGRVATHEIGHYLGLQHLWADDNDCNSDDGIDDTPPQFAGHGGCPTYPQAGCAASEMFMNFMDYVDDPCMLLFTQGQATAMRSTLLGIRHPLASGSTPCMDPTQDASALQAYPNPSDGKVRILFHAPPMKLVAYEILNVAGQKMKSGENLVNDQLELDLSDLAPGIYFLRCGGAAIRLVIL